MGLLNRIKRTNVTRNVWTQMTQITIICGLIVAAGTAITCNQGEHCGLAFVSVAAILAVAIVFIAWLVWFIYVIWAKRYLTPMALHGFKILDSIDFFLFTYWIIASIFKVAIGAWIAPIVALIWIASISIAIKYRESK